MVNQLLLLPWYITITGYQISSNNNNNQEKSTTGYGQTSKSLLGQVGQWEWKLPQTEYTCDDSQFKHANTMPIVLCTNNSLMCGYITGIHDH